MVDGFLERHLPAERPSAFRAMSAAEQEVRGRYFLMAWSMGASTAYAWVNAMVDELAELTTIVRDVSDERIETELALTVTERGPGDDVMFATFGYPAENDGRE